MEYIAYEGSYFTIEWYVDENNKSPARSYYKSLNIDERIQLLKLFKRMGDAGTIHDKTKFRYEGDKIYAFKPHPYRFLCFFSRKKIIVTNGFCKKREKLSINEKNRSLKYRSDFINRFKIGEYYEQEEVVNL